MRLFCDSSVASPFCGCKTHALPPSSPEIENAWQSILGEASMNSLAATDLTDDTSADLPVFPEREILEPTHTASPQRLQIDLPFPSPYSVTSLSLSDSTDSIGLTGSDDSDDASYSTEITVPSPVSKASTLSGPSEEESDLVDAAHYVYNVVTKDADTDSNDAEAMTRAVEHALQAVSGVNMTRLRTAIKNVTLQSFREVWRERSTLWHVLEHSSHPLSPTCSFSASQPEYGTSARRLASFAGALFAAGVLSFRDLQTCIDSVRNVPSRLALHALRVLIRCAGDRVCRAKTAAYMEALNVELENRAMAPEFVRDAEAQILLWEIRYSITCYFNIQSEKREKATAKVPSKTRPRKVAIASWSFSSF